MTALAFSTFAAEIGRILEVPAEQLHPELDVYEDFGIDSLGLVTIGDRLQDAYGVTIPAADMVTCFALKDFHQVVSTLVAQREGD